MQNSPQDCCLLRALNTRCSNRGAMVEMYASPYALNNLSQTLLSAMVIPLRASVVVVYLRSKRSKQLATPLTLHEAWLWIHHSRDFEVFASSRSNTPISGQPDAILTCARQRDTLNHLIQGAKHAQDGESFQASKKIRRAGSKIQLTFCQKI